MPVSYTVKIYSTVIELVIFKFQDCVCFQATFEKLENELREVNQNAEALKRNYLELTELKHILRKTQGFFDEVSCTNVQFPYSFCVFNIFL